MTITQAFKKLAAKLLGVNVNDIKGQTISEVIDYTADNYGGSGDQQADDKPKTLSFAEQCILGDFPDGRLVIPDGTTIIGERAFSAHEQYGNVRYNTIKKVIIPDGVTHIKQFAFIYCPALTFVYIPISVTYIGSSIFDNCKLLTQIHYAGTEEQWNAIGKQDNWASGLLVVPEIIYNYTPDTN